MLADNVTIKMQGDFSAKKVQALFQNVFRGHADIHVSSSLKDPWGAGTPSQGVFDITCCRGIMVRYAITQH